MQRNGVHAAQRIGEADAVAPIQVQRRLAIRLRDAGEGIVPPQLAVVVDLAIGDQRDGTREKRLVAGDQVDDREPGMRERDIAVDMLPPAIRSAMGERAVHRGQHRRVRRGAVA